MITARIPLVRPWGLLRCALLALLATACAASSLQLVPRPPQDVALSRPELCRIYVFRTSMAMGSVRTMRVYDQDLEIGSVAGGEYLCWERPAGHTLLRVVYEGPEIDRGELEELYDMQVASGSVKYFTVGLKRTSEHNAMAMGEKRGSPEFQLLSDEEGRKLLADSKPVAVR